MKISIVTVTYNSADFIADALRSVASQRYPEIEHIVIDGASRDGTVEQVGLHGPHVARLVSEPDHGIYDAMNKGAILASGEYVGFLNADDMLASPDVISQIALAAESLPDAIYGDLQYVEQSHTDTVVRSWRSGRFSARQLRFGWMPPHPTFYVRRSLIEELGGFDTSLRIAADYDFMMRCLTRPGVSVCQIPQVLVRMRMGGVSNGSIRGLLRKSCEDLQVMRRHGIGGWPTLVMKNLRKLPQFL